MCPLVTDGRSQWRDNVAESWYMKLNDGDIYIKPETVKKVEQHFATKVKEDQTAKIKSSPARSVQGEGGGFHFFGILLGPDL